jgi:hypothetical protein
MKDKHVERDYCGGVEINITPLAKEITSTVVMK